MQIGNITFVLPWAMLLFLLFPVIIAISRGSLSHMPGWQKAISCAWRVLILAVFAVILAKPIITRTSSKICAATLIDTSKSIPGKSFEKTISWIDRLEKEKPENAELRHFAFADRIIPLSEKEYKKMPSIAEGKIDDKNTNIAGAVFHATSLMPQDCDRRISVITDGRDTVSDLEKLPAELAKAGIRIFPVEPVKTKVSEIILEEMMVPPNVKTSSPFNVRAVVHSSDRVAVTVLISDSFEGKEPELLEELEMELEEGPNTITFTPQVREEGKHVIRAEILNTSMTELFEENNIFESALFAQGPNKVLYVEGEPSRGSHLRSALGAAGYKVSMEGTSSLAKGGYLDDFDAIFLSDVAFHKLPGGAFAKIKSYTAGGGIFVFTGGKKSYQMGGYRGTPFEPYLPVSMDVEEEVQKVSTAVILVLDKSGSMSGLPVQMAREAAKASVAVLDPETMVEVISFDSSPNRLFHMQKAKNKMMINSFISQIYSGGGTNIISALNTAYNDMVPVQAKKKHIVLLTDGQSSKIGIESLLSKASSNNMTISTIGLGKSVDRAFLEKIAVETGGKAYFTSNPKALPRLFMQEMRVVAPPAVVEGVLDVLVKKSTPFISKVGGKLPYVRGYNLTSARGGRAQTVLVSDRKDPVMAMWKQGKGWVVAFTPDVKSRWGAPWVGWKLFGKFWAELIRSLSGKEKKEEEKGGKINVSVEGDKVTVAVDLVDEASGEFIDGASGSGAFSRLDDKEGTEFKLEQTAPGHYRGEFHIKDYGAYFVRTSMKAGDGAYAEKANTSLNIPYPTEYRKIGTDSDMLELIAKATSGRLNPAPADIWAREGSDIEHEQNLWPWLILLLLCMIPLDIAIRRLPF
ncbi:MAG: VWA domain-containing protein [Pseudomonadota bacterium]